VSNLQVEKRRKGAAREPIRVPRSRFRVARRRRMSAALARSQQADLPVRKPPTCEPRGADVHRTDVVRQAFGSDVVGSHLSPRAQLGYRVLVDHVNRGRDPRRPYDGQVFLTMKHLHLSWAA